MEVIVHDEELLYPMLVQQLDGVIERGAHRRRDQVFLGHDLANLLGHVGLEPKIPVGEDADEARPFGDGHPADAVACHEFQGLGDQLVGLHRDGIDDHAALGALDLVDLIGLVLGREVPVDDADAAFLCQGDGQPRLRHRIHRGAHQRDVEPDRARKLGRGIALAGQHLRAGRHKQQIVEGEPFGQLLGA